MNKTELEYKKNSKTIIKKYIPAVILIIVLIGIGQVIIQYEINKDKHLSKVINIAGRQRMLSQKISKEAYAIYFSEDKNTMKFYLDELKTSTDTWKKSNVDLKIGNKSEGLQGKNSNRIMELFSKIDVNHQSILSAAYEMINMIESGNYNRSLILEKVNIIETNEKIFLKGMDDIVFEYDKEAQDKIIFLSKTEIGLFLITLIVILFEVIYIFLPAEKSLSKAFVEIEESNENMMKLFKTVHGAMFLVDEETFKVLLMNKEAEELANVDNVDNKSINIRDVIKCESNEYLDVIEKIKINEKNENIELVIRVNEKKNMTALLSTIKIYFHEKAAILIGLFDITIQKQVEEKLKNKAITDELTGLYNRHFLDEIINEEIQSSEICNEPLSMIILDLDRFKHINDTWGHPIGDEILKQTAQMANSIIRKSDMLFRFGGEEFILLMPRTAKKDALVVAENIRKTLAENYHPKIGKVTASFGVAEKMKFESFNSWYKRVDKALYCAKDGGRNRVVSSDNKESLIK